MEKLIILAFVLISITTFHRKTNRQPFFSFRTPSLVKFEKNEKRFINALIFGKKYFSRDFKKKVDDLNLHHLFTPSALHLSSLIFLIRWLPIKLLIFFETLFFFLLPPTGLLAFKRALLLKISCDWFKFLNLNTSSFIIFLSVYLLQFVFLGANELASFSYSFLFLSTIFALRHSSPFVIIFGLWLCQLMIHSLRFDFINLLTLPINTVLSFSIGIFFPLFIMSFILSEFFNTELFTSLTKQLIHFAHEVIDFMHDLSNSYAMVVPSILAMIMCYLFITKMRIARYALFIAIFATPLSLI